MAGANSGRGGNGKKKAADQYNEKYKDFCPPERQKDLDALVKTLNGDEDKIKDTLEKWWSGEEPRQAEPEWEDVAKKSSKKHRLQQQQQQNQQNQGSGYRGSGRHGPGRGGRQSRGGGGGRGAGAERRGRGRGGRGDSRNSRSSDNGRERTGGKGSRNNGNNQPAPAPANDPPSAPLPDSKPPASPVKPEVQEAPTPIPVPAPAPEPPVIIRPSVPEKAVRSTMSSGNVWATKGSAHLIQAETKPKPPQVAPAPPAPPTKSTLLPQTSEMSSPKPVQPDPIIENSVPVAETSVPGVEETKESLEPKEPPEPAATLVTSSPGNALESGLPASVNGANVNAAGWEPAAETAKLEGNTIESTALEIQDPPPSLGPIAKVQDTVKETVPATTPPAAKAPTPPKPEPAPAPKPPPTTVLSMGHWETTDSDETQNLDFGFGSFGTESEAPSVGDTTMSSSSATNNITSAIETAQPAKETPAPAPTTATTTTTTAAAAAATAATVSPARPPPGLSITGMPPMPTGAVLVSDLENKLETTTLGQKSTEQPAATPATAAPALPAPQPAPPVPAESAPAPTLPQVGGMSQNYNTAYGMNMYNYGAAGNGFVGMHGAPVLTGGIVPPQKHQAGLAGQQQAPTSSGPGGAPQHLPGGLYGTPSPAIGNVGAGSENSSETATNTTPTSAMPPGIPGAMPYNHALFYGQQPYQLGQPHGGVGYGYGYGAQFGGLQGGFSYQQVMGQGGGYPYDDQPPQQGNATYQKTPAGGYRGRNHNSGNQYQSQYNPPGGYAGQPYSMGYNLDHFGQRAGYGPGSMDPYAGSYGQSGIHSFQSDDDHHKGKKGGRSSGSNFQQQFQQYPNTQQIGGGATVQQPFALQGDSSSSNNNNNSTSNAGWSNHAGAWGTAPSWQGS